MVELVIGDPFFTIEKLFSFLNHESIVFFSYKCFRLYLILVKWVVEGNLASLYGMVWVMCIMWYWGDGGFGCAIKS